MKVLVTGANGQLGSEICFLQDEFKDLNFVFVDKNALDITDEKAVFAALCQGKFDAVIIARLLQRWIRLKVKAKEPLR